MEFKVIGEIDKSWHTVSCIELYGEEREILASNYLHKTKQEIHDSYWSYEGEFREVRRFYTLWLVKHRRYFSTCTSVSRTYLMDVLIVNGTTYITKIHEEEDEI